MRPFRVKVPATVANMGPGYDVLGMAVELFLEADVYPSEKDEFSLEISGRKVCLEESENAILEGINAARGRKGKAPLNVKVRSGIPLKKGLGSSAAARVAGLMIGGFISDKEVDSGKTAAAASELEGHPDNSVPAVFGGLTASCMADGDLKYSLHDITRSPEIIIGVPDIEISTQDARKAMPECVRHEDAVFTNGRVALLISALVKEDFKLLDFAMQDRLHQPYRKKFVPRFDEIEEASREAGAWGTAISGSGPSVFSFVKDSKGDDVGEAMKEVWKRDGFSSFYIVTRVSAKGAEIKEL